jgi:hypothetical protein
MSDTPKYDDSGPAFPLQSIGPNFHPGYAGMSLRYYTATKALQGLLANPKMINSVSDDVLKTLSNVIDVSYVLADLMLDKEKKNESVS